jgi:3-oxoacyl-[acyl-carrier-protein] synthase-3
MRPLYLSRPGLYLPETRLTNEDVLERIEARYKGPTGQWPLIRGGVELIFDACQSRERYAETDPAARIATMAVRAARQCLAQHAREAEELDLLIYSGIGRDYLEPATAMEVAGKLGIEQTRAFDVTSACAGQLMAIATACAWMQFDESLQTALICAAELPRDAMVYDIQSYEELPYLGAGATVGAGASAFLLSRSPLPGGSLCIAGCDSIALPQYWPLSQTPLKGRFNAQSSELLRIGAEAIEPLQKFWQRLGWTLPSVEQFLVHQPGQALHRRLLDYIGVTGERAINVHPLYGNTASVAVATAYHEYCRRQSPRSGTRLALLASGAGLSACVIAGEWVA